MWWPRVILAVFIIAAVTGCVSSVDTSEYHDHDGVSLYNMHCSACHGRLTATTKPGRRAARIHSAIRNNIGGMGFLADELGKDEVEAIAGALTLVTPPENASGDELYGLYCASCHGALENSGISGTSLGELKHAVMVKMCNTVNLQFLDEGHMEKIAGSLKQQ